MDLKKILITLSIIAGVLVIIAFYVVFYSAGGTYVVSSLSGSNAAIFGTSTASNSTTTGSGTSSTLAFASSSASSTASSSLGSKQADVTPITWTQGNETMSVVNAAISGAQLTLGVQVTMGSTGECVPLTMRLIADEQGDLSPPVTQQFTFPDTGSCTGTAGGIYSAQPIVFTLSEPITFPIILTTGGAANTLFEVTQNADGSLNIQLPPNAG